MRNHVLTVVVLMLLTASTAFAEKVTLTTGDVIYGAVLGRDNGVLTVKHPVLGELKIPIEQVSAVEVAPAPTEEQRPDMPPTVAPTPGATEKPAEQPAAEATAEPEQPKSVNWIDRYREQWDSTLEVGASATKGNTVKSNLFFSLKSKREREGVDRTKWDIGARWSSTNHDETENEATAGITHDWLQPDSKWFVFATGRYDYDEFQAWLHRLSVAGGIGHNTIDTDDFKWINRAGAGMVFIEGDSWPEGYLGTEVSWKITESQSLAASSTLYPDLADLSEFRLINKFEWTIKINQADGVRLKFGVEHEHQSMEEPGTKNDDVKVYSSLLFDF